ncbi:MAG: hypothetical protein ACREB9_04960 [Thermoplasmata archaeon]
MIFRPEQIDAILRGVKTQSRRRWPTDPPRPQVRVGGTYAAVTSRYTRRCDAPAIIRVTDLARERLGSITPGDAMREGGYTVVEFAGAWERINGAWNADETVWMVGFVLEEAR